MQILPDKLKKATSTGKGRIIAFLALTFILAAIGGGIMYWNAYKKQIIRNKLQDTIQEKTRGLYTLHYDSLRLDEVAGNLSVSNLKLVYPSF